MGALVPGLDDQVEYLMAVAPLADDAELTRWLTAVRAAAPGEEDRGVDDFARAFREVAAEWRSTTVDTFVTAVAQLSDGTRPVRKYAQVLQDSPATYWQLVRAQLAAARAQQPAAQPAPVQSVDRFGWLADRQAQTLAGAWGDQWQGYLGQQLDYRWGAGWEATYARTDSQGHLDQLIAEWVPQQPGARQPVRQQATEQEPEVELTPTELAEIVDEAVEEGIRTVPGADELSEPEIAEIAAEVRAEMTGSAT